MVCGSRHTLGVQQAKEALTGTRNLHIFDPGEPSKMKTDTPRTPLEPSQSKSGGPPSSSQGRPTSAKSFCHRTGGSCGLWCTP